MIPDRDYYADKDGKLTTDPARSARQIGVKGCFLDERVAHRYGITDTLVSVDEPNAIRRVTGRNTSSVQIDRQEPADEPVPAAEAADAASQEEETEANQKPAAKKGAKKEK